MSDTADGRDLRRLHLLNAYLRGTAPNDEVVSSLEDPEIAAQLHVNIERIRVPEGLYQPHIAGIDQAGLLEVIDGILKHFTASDRDRLTSVSCHDTYKRCIFADQVHSERLHYWWSHPATQF